ncbi:MAG: hypothetical protein D3913_11985 [Candidatus Electrothrix sp. LOE1_4_5]|nr:hypothetical protein [Candidatus Electrothrix gigas]
MGESSSGNWYKNLTIIGVIITTVGGIIAAIITGAFNVIAVFIGKKNDPPVQPLPSQTVSTTTTVIVTSAPSLQTVSEQAGVHFEPLVQPQYPVAVSVHEKMTGEKTGPVEIFQDDFEEGLSKWNVQRYAGYYNNFMRWHISENEHFSGKKSLALGDQDTDTKENNDTVHIETKKELLLTEDTLLSFQIKKEYRINLKIVLKDKDAPFKDTVIKFYPGNFSTKKEWRAEEILLGSDIDEGRYTLILKAWDQGRLYLDDIKIQN